jgi:MFS transporter, DHA1 family, multidrug resistance protein
VSQPLAVHTTPPRLIVWLLALLLGTQPITTDLYLPALPQLTGDLAGSVGQAQLTLTALLLCFGASQLFWGPLSDRWGRRPVLLWGMGLYALAGLANTLAPTFEWLIFTRAVQGAAMGAAVVCARAIVRDLYEPAQGARVMAQAMGGLGLIACMSPLLGGLLATWAGWRWALAVLAVFGTGVLTLLLLRFEETLQLPSPTQRPPFRLPALVRNWGHIVRHRTFIAWAGLLAASYAGLFTFLAASSFVFLQVYGFSKPLYGLAMASASLAYILGTLICRRLLPRLGLHGAVKVAGFLSLSGGTLMGLLALADVHTWWAFLLPHYLFMAGHGLHQPCAQTGAVGPFPQMAGAASALSGFLLTVVAFGVGLWLSKRIDGTVFPLVYGVWFWSAVIAFFAWIPLQSLSRDGSGDKSK